MDFLSATYLKTTNPETNYRDLLSWEVLFSVLLHLALYMFGVYIFCKIFQLKLKSEIYANIFVFLVIVMVLGYFGRLMRVKSLYKAMLKNKDTKETAKKKTEETINAGYFRFYFLG